jgi:RNA polymerase sigma-70 factor (ECF subfamily)
MPDRPGKDDCPDFASQARDGDLGPTAVEQILTCFRRRLERFAAGQCGNPDLGQDALQDAMLHLIQNLDSYRGTSPIEPWLRRLVVGACSRLKRGRKNAPGSNLPLDENLIESLGDHRPGAEELQVLRGELERVGAALKTLPELNRTLIYLHEADGVPIRELGERFQLSSEAVKSRLKRARTELRHQLTTGAGTRQASSIDDGAV